MCTWLRVRVKYRNWNLHHLVEFFLCFCPSTECTYHEFYYVIKGNAVSFSFGCFLYLYAFSFSATGKIANIMGCKEFLKFNKLWYVRMNEKKKRFHLALIHANTVYYYQYVVTSKKKNTMNPILLDPSLIWNEAAFLLKGQWDFILLTLSFQWVSPWLREDLPLWSNYCNGSRTTFINCRDRERKRVQ